MLLILMSHSLWALNTFNGKYSFADGKYSKAEMKLSRRPSFNAISGTVINDAGEPFPGVTVQVKGTTIGTVTDIDGSFKLDVPEGSVLIFSFIGYKTQEIPIANQTIFEILLEEDHKNLDEVVVIGYGTQKKSDLTGAVVSANVDYMTQMGNVSAFQGLQGSVPGLNIGAVDVAGQNPSFSIRGQNTISSSQADNQPLLVVDGMIYRGNIIDINTADIKSIDVLKDISSTAIYGSQASNGVILITTKTGGEAKKPVINYSASYSLQVPSNKLEPMEGEELDSFLHDAFWDNGSRIGPDYLQSNPDFTLTPYFRNSAIADNYTSGIENDWWGSLTHNGSTNNQNVSIRGGDEWVNYFLSGGITDVKGFMENEAFKKYNYRANISGKINDWLRVGLESFLTSSDYSGVSPDISNTFVMYPWAPIYDENGEYTLTPDSRGLNPFLQVQQDDLDKRFNLFGKVFAEVSLPFIEGLTYRINYSQNYRRTDQYFFNPWGANYTGVGSKFNGQDYDWILDNIVSYKTTFKDQHKLEATFLYGVEERNHSSTNSVAQNFVNDLLGYDRLQAGDPTLNTITTAHEKETSLYMMGRLFYSYKNKYMITGTLRRDGFSGFGNENKIGVFPSIALGWVLSDEEFLSGLTSTVDYLKLRASYGTSGRRGVSRYQTQSTVDSHPSVVFGDGGSSTLGQWITTLANDELGWETTTGLNLGLDFGFIGSRINGNIEYYNTNTRDILYNVQLPVATGFSSIAANIGKVNNWGVELGLNGAVVNQGNFKWNAGLVYSRNRNEIVSILGSSNDNDGDGKEDDLIANELFIGQPQGVNYNFQIEGMWQLADQEAGNIPSGFLPGTYKLADLNGDGKITATDDRKILGYKDPAYRVGLTNNFTYKNFNLYIFINSIQGGKNYYQANLSFGNNEWNKLDQLVYSNPPKGAWDYWMPENPDAKFRRPDTYSQLGQYAGPHQQRNFIRVQDVSLSYNFNKSTLDRIGVRNLKLFVSGKNLFTITKWDGWDPETGVGFEPGRPVMTSYTLGLNIDI